MVSTANITFLNAQVLLLLPVAQRTVTSSYPCQVCN